MVIRREGTSTGDDIVFSFASDDVARGEEGADFIKRRPTFPFGDDPRAREIKYDQAEDNPEESFASKNMVFRAYRNTPPLEGQEFGMPERIGKLQRLSDLRPELFSRSVDAVALDAAKKQEENLLSSSGFTALFPTTKILAPSPGSVFSPGDQVLVHAQGTSLGLQGGLQRAVLSVDGLAVDSIVLDRRDQDHNMQQDWFFTFVIPANRSLGPMTITVRSFNSANSFRGIVADDAKNFPPQAEPIDAGVGTLDGRKGSATSSADFQPLLDSTLFLRTPGGDASITVTIA